MKFYTMVCWRGNRVGSKREWQGSEEVVAIEEVLALSATPLGIFHILQWYNIKDYFGKRRNTPLIVLLKYKKFYFRVCPP